MPVPPASAPDLPTPRHPLWTGADPRLFESALALRAELPWLAGAFPEADSADFYFWIVNFGLRERPARLAAALPPFPSRKRMREISGSDDLESFLNVGAQAARATLEVLADAGCDPYAPRQVLDFGCGCARVLRHLLPLARRGDLRGCDIDAKAVAYCRGTMDGASFFANRAEPPLPVADGAFDLIYSISVFTHLGLEPARRWAAELRRALAPGGYAAVSVQGELAWRRVLEDRSLRREFGLKPLQIERGRPEWDRHGFVFLRHIVPRAWDHSEPYGLVFVREDRLAEIWSGHRLLRYVPGAISDWQDLALFQAS